MNKRKGYVTVFISLLLVVMIVVVTAVMEVCDRGYARTKMSTAISSSMSSELANYNRYVFDRYHILLLDKSCSGLGEGSFEQDMSELLKTNLGEGFDIENLAVSKYLYITEDDNSEFKKQIGENAKYELVEYAAEKIMEKTGGDDKPVDEQVINDMEGDISERQAEINGESTSEEGTTENEKEGEKTSGEKNKEEESGDSEEVKEEVTDPRDTLKTFTDAGIAMLILPEGVELSSEELDMSSLPSGGAVSEDDMEINTEFSDKNQMKTDGLKGNGWSNPLVEKAEALTYARAYFNSLTDKKYDDTVLNLEMEYLVAGKSTDGANYKKVVDEILVMRFAANFAYIVTDAAKMAECEALAAALSVEFPPMEPVIKYLLAGCWSYIESVADVYRLLRNHRVPYLKSSTTWITDLESLAHLEELEETEDISDGLDYNNYLMILAALQGNKLESRMLDLIQVNTIKNSDKSFRIKNCVTAFGVDVTLSYKGRSYNYHEEAGY